MNVILSSVHDVNSMDQFKDLMVLKSCVFWKFKSQDPDCSMRILPDLDITLDMFSKSNVKPIF